MSKKPPKNLAASVHQRLMNKAKETKRPFNELLQYFAMERFLYRLSESKWADSFVLKGALMLNVWVDSALPRPTLDIDLLGRGITNSVDSIVAAIQVVCKQATAPDGITFDPGSVRGEKIAEDAGYEGVRVRFAARLGNARIPMQLDVGFGDKVVPAAEDLEYPTILDFPAPHLRGYSKESTVAEKLEAAVRFGEVNSRMKDFFDIWFLARQFDFDGARLAEAISKTFATRGTALVLEPVPLTAAFGEDRARMAQWRAFRRKSRLEFAPEEFGEVVARIAVFLGPVLAALPSGQPFRRQWKAPGPWSDK